MTNTIGQYVLLISSIIAAMGSTLIVYQYNTEPVMRLTSHLLTVVLISIVVITYKEIPSHSPITTQPKKAKPKKEKATKGQQVESW
jgi:hypothetical protein